MGGWVNKPSDFKGDRSPFPTDNQHDRYLTLTQTVSKTSDVMIGNSFGRHIEMMSSC